LSLAEAQFLAGAKNAKVAQDFGDFEDAAGLDLVHVLAVPPVPRLPLDRDLLGLEDAVHLFYVLLGDDLSQPDRRHVARPDHDLHAGLEDLENIESLLIAADLARFETNDLCDTMGGVNRLVTYAKGCVHPDLLSRSALQMATCRDGSTLARTTQPVNRQR